MPSVIKAVKEAHNMHNFLGYAYVYLELLTELSETVTPIRIFRNNNRQYHLDDFPALLEGNVIRHQFGGKTRRNRRRK